MFSFTLIESFGTLFEHNFRKTTFCCLRLNYKQTYNWEVFHSQKIGVYNPICSYYNHCSRSKLFSQDDFWIRTLYANIQHYFCLIMICDIDKSKLFYKELQDHYANLREIQLPSQIRSVMGLVMEAP